MSDTSGSGRCVDGIECDRCEAETLPKNTLPLSDYRALVGENPVLCGDCRVALVSWINSGGEQA